MEKLFQKLFATKADGETPIVPRTQALPAFIQLYHIMLNKQPDNGMAAIASFSYALKYLNKDLQTYK